jgi:hypothetical protein
MPPAGTISIEEIDTHVYANPARTLLFYATN